MDSGSDGVASCHIQEALSAVAQGGVAAHGGIGCGCSQGQRTVGIGVTACG